MAIQSQIVNNSFTEIYVGGVIPLPNPLRRIFTSSTPVGF